MGYKRGGTRRGGIRFEWKEGKRGSFLDNFGPEDLIVVDLVDKESRFRRPDPASLRTWLEEYSIGEVWEKNVIGGGRQ